MIPITIETIIILLLAWAITYVTYIFEKIWLKLSPLMRDKIRIEKEEIDRITTIFYRYFYIYLAYFSISNSIINYIDKTFWFHLFGVGSALFFLYLQSYVIYRWKMVIKLMENGK